MARQQPQRCTSGVRVGLHVHGKPQVSVHSPMKREKKNEDDTNEEVKKPKK
jgi:hypothetical protein